MIEQIRIGTSKKKLRDNTHPLIDIRHADYAANVLTVRKS